MKMLVTQTALSKNFFRKYTQSSEWSSQPEIKELYTTYLMICIFKNKELLKHNNNKNRQKNTWIDIGSKAINRQQIGM